MAKHLWSVKVEDTDGRHTIGRYTTYAKALTKAKEWLRRAEWLSATEAIGEYGSRLTIESGDASWAQMTPADAEAMKTHNAEVTAWMRGDTTSERDRPVEQGGPDEIQDTCDCGARGYFPEGRCYKCQCDAHASGEINMDTEA